MPEISEPLRVKYAILIYVCCDCVTGSLNLMHRQQVMFPDMDAEVIEAVLRANNGAVDATIVSFQATLFVPEDRKMPRPLHSRSELLFPKCIVIH